MKLAPLSIERFCEDKATIVDCKYSLTTLPYPYLEDLRDLTSKDSEQPKAVSRRQGNGTFNVDRIRDLRCTFGAGFLGKSNSRQAKGASTPA